VTVTVYPVHVVRGAKTMGDARLGRELVQWLNAQGLADASFGSPEIPIPVDWHANQAKMAEHSAKAFGAWVAKTPPPTEYALLAEILCNPDETQVLGVHFYIAEVSGQLALGGLTNSHWDEFKRIHPVDRNGGLGVLKEMLQGSRLDSRQRPQAP
jgi:hypothetical protein